MPRKKQDKPQHLENEHTHQHCPDDQSAMKQSTEKERLANGVPATSEAVGDNCGMTSRNRCSPVSGDEEAALSLVAREDGESLSDELDSSADVATDIATDVAVISNSEWVRVKTSLSSIQQLLQVMRLQQFQIMQLLASKNPNSASTTTTNTTNTTNNNIIESGVGREETSKEEQISPAESLEEKQNAKREELAGVEVVTNQMDKDAALSLLSTSGGGRDGGENGSIIDDAGSVADGDSGGGKMDGYADRDSSTNADSDMCDEEQDEGEPESYDCSKCSAVLPTPELLRIHQLSHNQSLIPTAPSAVDSQKMISTATSSSQYLTSQTQDRSIHSITPPTSLPPSYQSVIGDLANDDSLEEYMEIQKPENTHLEQLAKSVDGTITDPNQCLICKRVLSCKSALMMHYRTHTGERPFKCKLCSRAFTTKGNLKTHMGVHRAKPPVRLLHNCPVCSKQFTNALVLNQHMKIHSDEAAAARKRGLHDSSSLLLMEESKRVRLSLEAAAIKNEINDAYTAAAATDLSKKQDPFSPMSLTAAAGLGLPFDLPGVVPPMSSHLRYAEALARQWEQIQQLSMFNPLLPPNPAAAALFSHGVGIPGPTAPAPLRMPVVETSLSNISPTANHEKTTSALSSIPSGPPSSVPSVSIPPASSQVSSDPASNAQEEVTSPSTRDVTNFISNSPKSEKSWGSNETNNTTSSMKLDPPPGTTCDLCPKTFACRSALEIHYRSHTKQRPFKCALCGKAFTTRGNMKQHVLTHKADESCWPTHERATPCSRLLQQPGFPLDQSVTSAEDARKANTKHQCSVCLKHFSSASAVQIHFRTHTGDRPFKCAVCSKAFTTKGNLKVHMGTHMAPQMWNGSPPQQGQKVSGEANGISAEIASHHNQSPHNNNFMDWSSVVSQASSIKAPMMNGQHPFMSGYPMFLPSANPEADGSKPWFWHVTCHLCNKECSSPAALELHIKSHAMNETKPKPMVAS